MDQKDAEALRQRVGSFTLNTTQENGPVCRLFDEVRSLNEGVDVLDSRGLTGSL